MAHRLLRDPDADGWERSDFPIVCETCLGPNPYVRMQRVEYGGECHISGRPYTVFRWRPGSDARYKKTIICQEVAKAKNVCQVCLLDLEYNLPVQVRDTALNKGEEDDLPESDVGKEFQLNRMAKDGELGSSYSTEQPNDTIQMLQRPTPYYKRNRAPICSFFVRGECKRGAECPYRHEMPTTGDLADQNIKDRYYGVNDPVAKKMLNRADNMPPLIPPEDTSISTLYIGNVTPAMTQDDLKDVFYSYGEIQSIKMVVAKKCAFVTYTTREAAEKAVDALHNKLMVKGDRCRLMWGKPQEQRPEAESSRGPIMLPPQVQMQAGGQGFGPPQGAPNYFNLPQAGGSYPSMNPELMGTREGRDAKRAGEPEPAAAEAAGGDHQQKRPRQSPEIRHPQQAQHAQHGPPPGWAPPPGGMGPPPPYAMRPPPQQMLRPGMVMVPMQGNPGVLVPMGMAAPMGGFRPPGPRPMAPAHQMQGPPGVGP